MNVIKDKIECPNCLGEKVVYNGATDKYEECNCESHILTNKCIDYEILEEIDIEILDYPEEDE